MRSNDVNITLKGAQQASCNYKIVVLKPNLVNDENTLTLEMLSDLNTKYIIKWNYDLNNKTIYVPANCVIEFDGGSFNNGTLIGNNTYIILHQDTSDVFKNITMEGTFKYTIYRGPNLIILTESEYDVLDSYDENTIYFVKE